MPRSKLLATIKNEGRKNGTLTVLLHAAVAERLGLAASDHKCADLMMSRGALTPTQLSELTGFSPAAITGVIDRLEAAGYVVREHDLEDRRRVLVRPTAANDAIVGRLFAPLGQAMDRLCGRYKADQLELILEFLRGCNEVLEEVAAQLRSDASDSKRSGKPARR